MGLMMPRQTPLILPSDPDIGTPMPQESSPWLNQRQYEHRLAHETTLYDPATSAEPYASVETHLLLEQVIARAKHLYDLTDAEEWCFRLSPDHTVEEISDILTENGFERLGAKTVRRRIASAIQKLRNCLSESP